MALDARMLGRRLIAGGAICAVLTGCNAPVDQETCHPSGGTPAPSGSSQICGPPDPTRPNPEQWYGPPDSYGRTIGQGRS